MAPSLSSPRAMIAEEDLHVVTVATLARFPDEQAEAWRIERVRQFLSEAAELGRVMHVHTNCAMVNHRGTFGARDLAASTAELYAAFEDYAALLRVLAGEFRGLLFGDAGIDGLTAPVPLAAGSVSFATPAATVVAAPVPHAFST